MFCSAFVASLISLRLLSVEVPLLKLFFAAVELASFLFTSFGVLFLFRVSVEILHECPVCESEYGSNYLIPTAMVPILDPPSPQLECSLSREQTPL